MPVDGQTFQNKLTTFCAPTLSARKVGSLFNINKKDIPNYRQCIHYFNLILRPYDIHITVMKNTSSVLLVYVYHVSQLRHLLAQESIRKFLIEQGYHLDGLPGILGQLKKRMLNNSFPHEIGVFLGYPLYDVIHFLHHDEEKCIGYWKVYGNAQKAQKKFYHYDCYKKTMQQRVTEGEDKLLDYVARCGI